MLTMVHFIRPTKQGMYVWRCAFCGNGFPDMYSRDLHEVHCPDRKGAKQTAQGRRIGTAW